MLLIFKMSNHKENDMLRDEYSHLVGKEEFDGILKWLLKFINLFKAREIKTLFEGEPAPSTWGATTARCRVAESNYGVWWW